MKLIKMPKPFVVFMLAFLPILAGAQSRPAFSLDDPPFYTMTYEEAIALQESSTQSSDTVDQKSFYLKKLSMHLIQLAAFTSVKFPKAQHDLQQALADSSEWNRLRADVFGICEKSTAARKTCDFLLQDRLDAFDQLAVDHNPHDGD